MIRASDIQAYGRYYQQLRREGLPTDQRLRLLADWREKRERTRAQRERELRLGTIWDGPWSPQSSWPAVEDALIRAYGPEGIRPEVFREARRLPAKPRSCRELWTAIHADEEYARQNRVRVNAAGLLAMAA